ncbi:AAA family ATPase [Gemmata sp. G18]|uniref:AAA family ATPase n=1 Tax=Gemmata palustris TaxID=2822762 RepID=A0ABS5BRC4_9BACT|nr:AAA family ATPase [Gemmata palustris]MBP3955423.1 AAA family ATPase [Gemmata palustris]
MTFTISPAKRKAVPMLISLAGVSGSGKTYSALLLAAGLAGKGPVGFLDTENGRGSMYADSPGIMAAMPDGYEIAEMKEPFAPARYSDAVEAFEKHGCRVLVIDSMTHEWEGDGGCSDIAENNKMRGTPNWIMAKREHKRLMNHLLASGMHLIFCLRAREKIKVVRNDKGKEEFLPIGLQPIQEKNFTFEMTLSLLLEEGTHRPIVTKCPEPLLPLFAGEQPLVTKEMGRKLRAWSDGGAPAEENPEVLFRQGSEYAAQGTAAYVAFWETLTGKQQKLLLPKHDENKELARMADDRQKVADPSPRELNF